MHDNQGRPAQPRTTEPPRGIRFNIQLSPDEKQRLDDILAFTGRSRAQVIREAVAAAHAMYIHGIPTCSTGQRCFVPQMHPVQTTITGAGLPPHHPPEPRRDP